MLSLATSTLVLGLYNMKANFVQGKSCILLKTSVLVVLTVVSGRLFHSVMV